MAEGDDWEAEVRRLLADEAARPRPTRADLAGVAITRARRVRRRRGVIGFAMIVIGTVAATGVALHDWRGGGESSEFGVVSELAEDQLPADPSPDEVPELAIDVSIPVRLSTDLVGDGTTGELVLATAHGQTIPLGPIEDVSAAYRFGEGWAVVSGQPGTTRLWWVTGQEEPRPLLAGMDAIVVGHGQVAWQRGVILSAATLTADGQLADRVSTAAPRGDGLPVGFVQEAVLMERTGSTGWDTWHPGHGDYRPTWTDDVLEVYGSPSPSTVGLVPPLPGADGPCLAQLDIELEVDGVSCVPEQLSPDAPGAVSPRGDWLLNGSLLVDLQKAFSGARDEAVTEVADAAPAVTTPVWLGPDRVLFRTEDSLVQLWPGRLRDGAPDAVEQIPLYASPPWIVQPV
ncbi:MAG TPA: hypothetical protein VIL37_10745 [Natronosporangium sp.]